MKKKDCLDCYILYVEEISRVIDGYFSVRDSSSWLSGTLFRIKGAMLCHKAD